MTEYDTSVEREITLLAGFMQKTMKLQVVHLLFPATVNMYVSEYDNLICLCEVCSQSTPNKEISLCLGTEVCGHVYGHMTFQSAVLSV